ncbi:hypothetical protein BRYFOR_07344 [Marvinbryantia formatexigens DSM 14469]|uniref:Uncharacterized protein n=1 Tax=Marvinbryantia formatexigens DSM 14469 TaxID=478749 RepID=C6LFE2_9FIRM|nr:hypothetical protein BRYFOR_07344 [Marvinbryantia formatexigens DSM 14469]
MLQSFQRFIVIKPVAGITDCLWLQQPDFIIPVKRAHADTGQRRYLFYRSHLLFLLSPTSSE